MRSLFLRGIILLVSLLNFIPQSEAQKKLLILGSSTSTCFFGPSSLGNCYVTKLQQYYQGIGSPFTLDNRAVAGDNIYQGMPLNFSPPAGRNSPRPYNNITDGLTGNPDVVLINYPSNGYDYFSLEEVMNCLRTIKQAANNAGKPCYITTSQPRNDPSSYLTEPVRNKMAAIKNAIMDEFGVYAINFWDGIADPINNSLLNNYQTDGVHINDAGHAIFFNRVLEKNIFSPPPPPGGGGGGGSGGGLTYKYFEGEWNTLPDFNALQPVKSGSSSNVDLSPRNRGDHYAFLWEGSITIPSSGNYTFEIVSDDGSKLYFNSQYNPNANPLVNNDGLHAPQSASNTININAPGSYPIAITFFENTGGDQMQVYWSGPGFSRQLIPNQAFSGQANSPGAALNYKYYEGDWNTLPDFNALQPVKTGSSSNIDLSPRSRGDHYAFLWEGYISIATPGIYNFETVSDDGSKLYFNASYNLNANPLVNNDGLHAARSVSNSININAPGLYPIAISFFEKDGGEQMQLYWSGPGFSRQLIPDEAFSGQNAAAGGGGGFNYKYYEGDWNALPNFSNLQPVKTGTTSNIDMSPKNRTDNYAFLWEGSIKIPVAGVYTFETISDDGSKLYFNQSYHFNANPVVNNDGLHPAQSVSGSVQVAAAGVYPIAITFFEKTGGELMQVYWSGPGFSRQLISNEAFSGTQSLANFTSNKIQLPSDNNLPNKNLVNALTAYPNPFNKTLAIGITNSSANNKISAGLFDLSGKRVFQQHFKNVSAGSSTLQLNINHYQELTPGIYILKIDINGIPFKVARLVKTKN